VSKKAGIVDAPYEFLFVCELNICEGCVFFVEREVGSVLRGAGEEGTVFECLREGCVCVFDVVGVCVSFKVGVFVGYGFPKGLWNEGVWPGPVAYRDL
jgi:hypothetical protein